MKNIHILPTDKPSILASLPCGTLEYSKTGQLFKETLDWKPQNIYITSDEEIKFNDYITDRHKVWQWKDDSSLLGRKKIILTTDQDLINDGVQSIDDEFLEWLVKNPSCEEVEVKRSLKEAIPRSCAYDLFYEIVIPKEEPKQETLEEAIERLYGTFEDCKGDEVKTAIRVGRIDGFYDATKWQAERMYSEEDMAESFMACWKANVPEGIECKLSFNEWFEQFKKK